MPCGLADDDYELARKRQLRNAINDLTIMLCSTFKVMENGGKITDLPKHMQDWWDNHKKEDEARKDAEVVRVAAEKRLQKIKAAALAKLTADEKAVLGL